MRYLFAFLLFSGGLVSAENRYTDEKRIDIINEKIDNLKSVLSNISERMQKNNDQLEELNQEITNIDESLKKFINGVTYGFEFYNSGSPINP